MDSTLITQPRPAARRRPLAAAIAATLLITGGLMAGCDNDGPATANKTPLGQHADSAGMFDVTVDGGEVIARINGSPLYRENLEVVKENLGASVPESRLVSRMVELRLLADQARKDGIADDTATQARIQNAIDNQLANAYLTQYLANLEIDESELQKAYEKMIQDMGGEQQHRAAHILVDDEETARELLDKLGNGADFAALAREYSTDTGSGENGGDLGWFSLDQMVEPFANAVAELEPGELTQNPVKSQFGWHIIKLEGVRESPPPTFEQLRPQLEENLRREAINREIEELRASANVEILTDEVRSMVDRDASAEGEEPTPPADARGQAGSTEDSSPQEAAAESPDDQPAEGGRDDLGGLPAEPLKAMP
ncbi:MAG: peptidylprolyl isomerase [Halothiobacillaceae bacterium]|nr:peptidylprolyl isomerase [Halothiobacillaceae bacterium]